MREQVEGLRRDRVVAESTEKRELITAKVSGLWLTKQQFKDAWPAVLRGTGIGSILGLLPGGGAMLASFGAYALEKKPRMFEIRTYESYSELKAIKKVEMFNSGEIEAMREVGLGPIFYGQTLLGPGLPRLTYMVSAENQEAHSKHWGGFGKHPTWNKLKNDPQYADTVSKIVNRFLVPTAYSQI